MKEVLFLFTMKSSDPIFEERQSFRQLWLWLLIGPILLFSMIISWLLKKEADPLLPVILSNIVILFVIILFIILRLETRIVDEGIFYRFFPLQRKFRSIKMAEIEKLEVIKYNPIRDFGGWGIRYGLKGRAYNVSGNMGLMIYRKDGKRILIGTRKPDGLREVIEKLKSRLN